MTYIQLFLLILIVHFLADFAMQTHEQATKKGEGWKVWNKWLFYHVGVYTLIWGVFYWIVPLDHSVGGWLAFMLVIGIPHYIVDWVTSRLSKPFFKSGDFHNGFVVVGFDQVLHYICILWVLSRLVTII